MKIVAGLGSIDDYEAFVSAGADEFFAGYVPFDFISQYGRKNPINRREVIYYNVQIGSESELLILKKMREDYGKNISIAINALSYIKEQYDDICKLVKKLIGYGFDRFIVADQILIELMGDIPGTCIEISGELGVLNRKVIETVRNDNVGRIIFPRQTSIEDMKLLIDAQPVGTEFEAFVLNEKCHFTGAYCNSLHCDEMCHICKVPYRLAGSGEPCGSGLQTNPDSFGATGCAVCDLWKLNSIGVTHLKVVGRGNYSENTLRDIRMLKEALSILEKSENEKEYLSKVKEKLFPEGCSNNCYRYCAK